MAEQLVFARSLYARQAVEQAAKDFAELAKIEVTVRDDEVELSITEPDPDVAHVIVDEIANHALFLTVGTTRD